MTVPSVSSPATTESFIEHSFSFCFKLLANTREHRSVSQPVAGRILRPSTSNRSTAEDRKDSQAFSRATDAEIPSAGRVDCQSDGPCLSDTRLRPHRSVTPIMLRGSRSSFAVTACLIGKLAPPLKRACSHGFSKNRPQHLILRAEVGHTIGTV